MLTIVNATSDVNPPNCLLFIFKISKLIIFIVELVIFLFFQILDQIGLLDFFFFLKQVKIKLQVSVSFEPPWSQCGAAVWLGWRENLALFDFIRPWLSFPQSRSYFPMRTLDFLWDIWRSFILVQTWDPPLFFFNFILLKFLVKLSERFIASLNRRLLFVKDKAKVIIYFFNKTFSAILTQKKEVCVFFFLGGIFMFCWERERKGRDLSF